MVKHSLHHIYIAHEHTSIQVDEISD